MLFRPIGQQAFSAALGVLRSRGVSTEDAVANLCLAPTGIGGASLGKCDVEPYHQAYGQLLSSLGRGIVPPHGRRAAEVAKI